MRLAIYSKYIEQNWFQKWQTLWVKATKISACYWKTKHNLVFTGGWFKMIKRISGNFSILPLFGTNIVHCALVTGVQITNIKKCEQHEFIYCWIEDIPIYICSKSRAQFVPQFHFSWISWHVENGWGCIGIFVQTILCQNSRKWFC